jgi:alpha-1,6-mannosyltransferase
MGFKPQVALYSFALISALVSSIVFTIGGFTSFFQISAGNETSFNNTLFNGLTSVRFLATLGYLGTSAAYLAWLILRPPIDHLQFRRILRLGLPFLILAWIAYPLSSDIYLYLQYGLMGLQGVNPYIVPASHVSTVINPFLYWLQTSTYGPVSEAFFVISALFIKISPILAVYIFKTFCLLVHVANAYLIWRLLKSSADRGTITAAYLLSPFLLFAHVADAHVDVFLCFSVIVLVGCLYRRAYLGAILALIAGFLTKTLPIIWFPLVGLFLIRQHRWKTLAAAAIITGGIFLLLNQTLFPSWSAWKSLLNPGVTGMTARSIHHLVNLITAFARGTDDLTKNQAMIQQLSRFTFLCFALFYLWKLVRLYLKRNYSEANLVSDLGWVTLFLLLGATPWLMAWYPSVLLPIAALSINAPVFALTSFVFALTAGAVVGAGSGDTLLSLAGCFVTLIPAFAVLLLRRQVWQIYQGYVKPGAFQQSLAETQLLKR